jgi:hypothetical protein
VILCQITSQTVRDQYANPLKIVISLLAPSNVLATYSHRLFTADGAIVAYQVGIPSGLQDTEATEAVIDRAAITGS